MQFSDRLRQKYTRAASSRRQDLCRWRFDRCALGCYIQFFNERSEHALVQRCTVVDASLWMLTTAIALAFALKRKIPHTANG